MSTQTYPQFQYDNLSIINVDGKEYKLNVTNIVELNLTESIMYPGITGELIIYDNQFDLFATKNIYPGAKFKVSISMSPNVKITLNGTRNISREFTIYGLDYSISDSDKHGQKIIFKICSDYLIDGYSRKYSKYYYKKDLSFIAKDIIQNGMNAQIEIFEDIKQKPEHFILPLWSPIHSLSYIMSFALSKQRNVGGYLFYENMKNGKVKFETFQQLKERAWKQGQEAAADKNQHYIIRGKSPLYFGNIGTFTLKDYNTILQIQRGENITKILDFFYDHEDIFTDDKSIKDIKEFVHHDGFMNIPKKYFQNKKKYTSTINTFLYPNKDGKVEKSELKDFIYGYKTSIYNSYLDMVKVNFMSLGHVGRRCGDGIFIKYPSLRLNKTVPDEMHTGIFIVRDLKHVFRGTTYYQFISAITDGYKMMSHLDNFNKVSFWIGE